MMYLYCIAAIGDNVMMHAVEQQPIVFVLFICDTVMIRYNDPSHASAYKVRI